MDSGAIDRDVGNANGGFRIEGVRAEGAEGHGGEELRGDFMVDDHDPLNAQAALAAADALMVELGEAGLHADGVRYGPLGFVALVVMGVPVRRRLAMDDEMSWLWAREARLEAVRSELAAGRRWAEWELLCKRLDRVYALSNELWRRWREGPPMSAGVCKSLVVVGTIGEVVDGVGEGRVRA